MARKKQARTVDFDFELWAAKIDGKTDKEAGRMFREYVMQCIHENPRKAKTISPETLREIVGDSRKTARAKGCVRSRIAKGVSVG